MNNNKENSILAFKEFFNEINKCKGHSNNGKDFEKNIMNLLETLNFRSKTWNSSFALSNVDFTDSEKINIKKQILAKNSIELVNNPNSNISYIYIYIYQPFGSQNFPDFLIITKKYILPLEIKFSTKNEKNHLPKWNSNIPKSNCLYIYSRVNEDVIYFLGSDFIGNDTRCLLNNFFSGFDVEIKEKLNNLKSENKENPFGLKPYIRKDYTYDKGFCTSKDSKKGIYKYAEINHWKQNLLHFLDEISLGDE